MMNTFIVCTNIKCGEDEDEDWGGQQKVLMGGVTRNLAANAIRDLFPLRIIISTYIALQRYLTLPYSPSTCSSIMLI